MKKFLSLLGALALLVSCSTTDNDNDSDNGNKITLPKKVQNTNPDHPEENSTSVITYNGKKIVSVTENEEERTDYIYEGNLVVKTITYDITYNRNDKKSEKSYTYTDGKLSSSISVNNFTSEYPFGEHQTRSVYSYNADGTIKKETYSTNATTGEEQKNDLYEILTYQNGNLIKVVEKSISSDRVRTSDYEYDGKDSPYKYILGLNLLLDEEFDTNNLIKHTYSVSGTDSEETGPFIYSIEYEYNESGYPVKQTYHNQDGTVGAINEYFY
ncbi:hypothetical protein [Flavobacterium sp. 1355]|uniref:hypothetical protein n=1 Tax=Flavobacterium sp. 1355 TaxID=2806571 RepID=UPI001AE65A3D|nr:hypothetical protein [Flavobacterium sp. 1355]MBP1223568.1 hypothetical protein [Flavobacterium sp. 1355]